MVVPLEEVERETRGFWESFGRHSGGEVRRERGVVTFRSGLPLANYNGVIDARLAPEDADAEIRAQLAAFAPLPLKWLVFPSTTPRDMGARLALAGFDPSEPLVLMSCALADLPPFDPPADISVERVKDAAQFDAWVQLSFDAPRTPGSPHDCVWRAHRPLVDSDDHAYFILRREGVTVARSILRTTDGYAGLYGVFTAEKARGQGLGRLATLAALAEGARRGLREGTLQASAMGLPVYKRLGFAEQGIMQVWEWREPAARVASPIAGAAPPR